MSTPFKRPSTPLRRPSTPLNHPSPSLGRPSTSLGRPSAPFSRPSSFLGSTRFNQPQFLTALGSKSIASNPFGVRPSQEGRRIPLGGHPSQDGRGIPSGSFGPPQDGRSILSGGSPSQDVRSNTSGRSESFSQLSQSDETAEPDRKKLMNEAFETLQTLHENNSECIKQIKHLESLMISKEDQDNIVQKKLDDLRPQVRDLRTDSRKLKDENHHVRSELDEAKSKNEELIATNEDLEKARLEALDDVSMMEIKRGRLWLTMDNEISSTLALKEVEVSTIEAKFNRAQKEWNSTQTKYKNDIIELNSRNNAILEKVNLWDAERLRLHARMGDISRMLKEREECVSANNALVVKNHSIAIDSISKKLLASENSNSELREKLVGMESKLGTAQQEYQSELLKKEEQNSEMRSDLKNAKDNAIGQLDEVIFEKDQLKDELRNQKNDMADAKSRCERMESENMKLVTQLKAEEARVKVAMAALQKSHTAVKHTYSTMEAVGKATTDYFSTEAKLLQIPRTLSEAVESKLQAIRGSLSSSVDTIANLSNELSSKNKEIIQSKEIAHASEMAKKKVDASLAESEKKLEEVSKELDGVKDKLRTANENLEEQEAAYGILRQKLEEAEKEKEELAGRVKESTNKRKRGDEGVGEGSVASKGRGRKKQKMTLNASKKVAKRRSPRVRTTRFEGDENEVVSAREVSPASDEVEIVEPREEKVDSPKSAASVESDDLFAEKP